MRPSFRTPFRPATLVCAVALILSAAGAAAAQDEAPPPAPQAGEALTVFLLTMGYGDAIWQNFGHNAILIRDAASGTDIAYNYGMFDFFEPGFYQRFLRGTMRYWLQGIDFDRTIASYAAENRTIWAQELNLMPAQRAELQAFLQWNAREENRYYRYDYFRDNCSTRVRDALDRVLGGSLQTQLRTVSRGITYRDEALRLTSANVPIYAGIDLGLGPLTDTALSAWEESFVPMRLRDHVRTVTIMDADGRGIPLVADETVLFQSTRAAEPAAPPQRLFDFLLAGLLLGALVAGLGWLARRNRLGMLLLGVAIAVWALGTGLLGIVLTGLWAFTDHVAAYRNWNLLHTNPLALVLAVAAPLALIGHRANRIAVLFALVLAALSLVGLLLNVLPFFPQESSRIAALLLPVHLAVAWSLAGGSAPASPSFRGDAGERAWRAREARAAGRHR